MSPSPWTVSVDPLLAAGVALVGSGLLVLAVRARERRGWWRRAVGVIATLLLAAAWLSPLHTVAAHYLLTAHLIQITLVMGVVPPLILLALPGRCPFALPAAVGRVGRGLVHPLSGMLSINAGFFAWHLGPVYDASLRNPEIYAAQQISLLLVSLLFWWPIVVPAGGRRVLSRWATLGYILVATIPQTFGGITVAMAKHPLYRTYALAPRLFGASVMSDQQIAGACIALVSKLALFTAFAVIFMRMLNEPATDDGDDGGGGGGRRPRADLPSPQPSGSVPWLAALNAGRTVAEPAPPRRRVRVPAGAGSRPE
ncbi:MAG: cytochrome c oxidase assembly protein [Candidatus Dormibacteraeota bacterium]|uniref:Cytochrome c oxidase assembly protein n=1 Tax=Candidatus Amunia macphersoniae TaxID=3127014 RepID=A0A934NG99_9BACT|nr:cytochrome c oxidase assembly protein [Candidatus Dormibacteraeota bacterium]